MKYGQHGDTYETLLRINLSIICRCICVLLCNTLPLLLLLNTKVTIWISMEVDEVSDSVEFLWVILPRLINLFSRKTKSL